MYTPTSSSDSEATRKASIPQKVGGVDNRNTDPPPEAAQRAKISECCL